MNTSKQGYRDTKGYWKPRFMHTGIQGYRDIGIQEYTGIHEYKDTWIQ